MQGTLSHYVGTIAARNAVALTGNPGHPMIHGCIALVPEVHGSPTERAYRAQSRMNLREAGTIYTTYTTDGLASRLTQSKETQ